MGVIGLGLESDSKLGLGLASEGLGLPLDLPARDRPKAVGWTSLTKQKEAPFRGARFANFAKAPLYLGVFVPVVGLQPNGKHFQIGGLRCVFCL